jgi:dihydrofolate reductase
MKRLVLGMHVSLDGYVAGVNGEMNWIRFDEELFAFGKQWTDSADTALYGKNTYLMMDGYWPTAADKPDAGQHDIDHAAWYMSVQKFVISSSLKNENASKTTFIDSNIIENIKKIKQQDGKNIMMYGSPSVVHALSRENLIDEYVLFVNPILLGQGIPLFKDLKDRTKLDLVSSKSFSTGVVCLHYKLAL